MEVPGGEGRIIALEHHDHCGIDLLGFLPEAAADRSEPRHSGRTVDDAEAAREVRRGSRVIGERRFEAALLHQRAMYLKQMARGEDRLVMYGRYPEVREVVRY
ncbi:MAG: hypothetical protein ACRDJN_06655 [Chloroflexota bacterium]